MINLKGFKEVIVIAKNQFVVVFKNGYVFQSYDSIISCHNKELKITKLFPGWNMSKTTTKYLIKFLNEYCGANIENKKDIEEIFKDSL